MPRFFLHSFDHASSVFDDVGKDLKDMEDLRKHAVWCVKDIIVNSILIGSKVDRKGFVSAQDIDGNEYFRVKYGDISQSLGVDNVSIFKFSEEEN